ncbi:putative Receptor-type tyrosine-protein phosphatase N2 [Hypsibius exemplaris]|uniref:Receptor-type tyrosine-protein phosphatase N2 n=1 Tax=Hypsibius exemplaris TaxID=2072580 RepID=A0A9X6NIR2_HYPEX|nr:putative Receptor-type tyrosine-protein phosphatase N2 [Hypsibius exemplaris]
MPSDESQDSVGEDVTVTVVKGSAEKPIPSGSDAADGSEDDYVFLITEPRLPSKIVAVSTMSVCGLFQIDLDQARYFLTWLAAVMNMPAQTFYDVSVSDDLMTFRVNPAVESLNATYVAQTLGGDDLRNGLRQTNNMEVLRAGVGRYTLDKSSGVDGPLMRFQQTAVVQSESAAAVEAEIAKKYDVVDPTYAFIVTEPALTYDKARRMLNWLSVKLHVPQTIFSSLLIEDHQLLFRVSPYYNQINASGVVDRLSDAGIQAELRKEFQVEIIRNGIGHRVQIVKADKRQRETLLIGLIAVACVAAILISLGIIYLVRRNIMMRKKLAGLGGDVESSKEYEELCRQRMASKNIESAVSSSPDHKNHDRSSTSSWSEEPAPTNMDITTGHMVLSYMEDHLKH